MRVKRIAVVGIAAFLAGGALLGSLFLDRRGTRAEGAPHAQAAPPDRARPQGELAVPDEVPEASAPSRRQGLGSSELLVEVVTPHLSFAPFEIRVLDPSSLAELGKKLVGRSATWTGLPGSQVLVTVTSPGWRALEQRAPSAGHERIPMEPLSLLQGNVVDVNSGAAIEAFSLLLEHRIEPVDEPPTTFAHQRIDIEDPQGAFSLAGLPMTGNRLRLVCDAPGYLRGATDWFPVEVWAEGLLIELSSQAAGLARIAGRVVGGAERRPVSGAQVHVVRVEARLEDVGFPFGEIVIPPGLRPGAGPSPGLSSEEAASDDSARSGSDGSFELRTRASGDLRLIAFHPDWGLALGEVLSAEPGELLQTSLEFGTPNALVVRLSSAGEARMRVRVVGPAGERSTFAMGSEDMRFPGLAPGLYRVEVTSALAQAAAGEALQRNVLDVRRVQVMPEGETTLAIDLERKGGTTLVGAILAPDAHEWRWHLILLDLADSSGQPDPGEQRGRGATVLAGGAFEIEHVLPGSYALAAQGYTPEDNRTALIWRPLRVEASTSPSFLELSAIGRLVVLDARADVSSAGALWIEPEDPGFGGILGSRPAALLFDASGESWIYGLPAGRVTVEREGRRAERQLSLGHDLRIELGGEDSGR